jgi:NADH-ubiquinone oxidoreductase chain 1
MVSLGLNVLVVIVIVLISVAFITLLERKILGYCHIRKGPNKVGLIGILQPIGDAVKLFTREYFGGSSRNFYLFYLSPFFGLFLALFVWLIMPLYYGQIDFEWGVLFFVSVISLGVYVLLGSGWASNSSYALLGALRALAQTISYEVRLFLLILGVIFYVGGYSFYKTGELQMDVWFCLVGLPIVLPLFTSLLAETNRTPFDFAEGESELVSGFNVEYGAVGFSLLFMAEYAMIILMSSVFVLFFFGGGGLFYGLKICLWVFVFLWVRGTLPRFRYDKLIGLCWRSFLSVALFYLLYVILVSMMI